MDKKINWFIPPLVLIIIIIIVNAAYYKRKNHYLKKIVVKHIKQEKMVVPQKEIKKEIKKEESKKKKAAFVSRKTMVLNIPKATKKQFSGTAKKFAIQVASFRRKKRAFAFVDSLKKDGYKAYIVTKNLGKKGLWYRVRIGSFSNKDDAESALKEIKAKYLQSFITSYINP